MSDLNDVKSEKITLMIHGREREIKFGFSAWATLEKEYGGINKLSEMQKQIEERPFETIPHLLYLGLKDKEGVTEDNVLDDYGLNDVEMISEKFTKALYGSLPQNNEPKNKLVEA